MRFVGVLSFVLVVGMVAPMGAGAVPRVPTTDLLPPVVPDEPAPDASGVCGDHGLRCLRHVERELARWESRFGCDHRAVFATTYRLLTAETRRAVAADPGMFDDPAGLGLEALAFYEHYADVLEDDRAGRPLPRAWELAMSAADSGDWTAGHDMLLGINAHVQHDMPFAVEEVGLVLPDGTSRKPDHDRFNEVLADAYQPIVEAVGRRYDPLMSDIGALPVVDDVGAQQLVAGWREGVWRNAESLVTTRGTALRPLSEATIRSNATAWAHAVRTGPLPGRRELRDAWCRAALAPTG